MSLLFALFAIASAALAPLAPAPLALAPAGPEAGTLSADEQAQVSDMSDEARAISELAGKLRKVRIATDVRYAKAGTRLRSCRVTTASGDAEIDAIPCAVTQECADRNPVGEREMAACTRDLGDMRIMALFEARSAGGDGKP